MEVSRRNLIAAAGLAFVAFARQDAREVAARLKQARIDIAVYPHRIRISPSVYNDLADVDKLLEALS